ncbi:uncharacterized protein LOC131246782 isoform X2 [Magnolia sinica]|uniref:uncharacterized protein LOC131246782 isoform X2 n=1 Tax=Magnolia sinica TaxID=86752 RepID=UPI0026580049|nr:uncharacterized protein LOC131246782 isoform X2 [Magnolia sinica]
MAHSHALSARVPRAKLRGWGGHVFLSFTDIYRISPSFPFFDEKNDFTETAIQVHRYVISIGIWASKRDPNHELMACRTFFRSSSLFIPEPWLRPFPPNLPTSVSPPSSLRFRSRLPPPRLKARVRVFHRAHFKCCFSHGGENPSSSSSPQDDQGPPQEAVLKAISEVSKTEGRVAQTRNVVIGGTVTDDSTNEWLALDQKVNSYPTVRGFTAIGTGGDDFVQAMVVAVESVLQQPIPEVWIFLCINGWGLTYTVETFGLSIV